MSNNGATRTADFIRGFASAFDLSGRKLFPAADRAKSGWEQDGEALRGDWRRVGSDMRTVMDSLSDER